MRVFFSFFQLDETPRFDSKQQEIEFQKHKPHRPPEKGDANYVKLEDFCKGVQIILQTVNENEYQAAVTFMRSPPNVKCKGGPCCNSKREGVGGRAFVFPSAGKVVGMFADHPAALIQTDVGVSSSDYIIDAIATFPNAKYVIAVGVAYAFDKKIYKFGDVLVSKKINDLRNFKFDKRGGIQNRGEAINVVNTMTSVFCKDLTFDEKFEVTSCGDSNCGVRCSRVYAGTYASCAILMDNKIERDKFRDAVPEVIGGEMEGGELLRFQQNRQIEGIIVIKGVVDYGDGTKAKGWQFTAAMAAFTYTHTKLQR